MSKTCYIPIGGVDDVLAKHFGWYYINDKGQRVLDGYRVANLRAMYDERGTPLNLDNLADTAKKLGEYYRDLAKINTNSINTALSNQSSTYRKLRNTFSLQKRHDRVNMIATIFSQVVDSHQKRHPNIPRQAILQGFYDNNGVFIGGQTAIFQEVYNKLMNNRARYYRGSQVQQFKESVRKEYAYKFEELNKVLQPEIFGALAQRARFILRDTEGIIAGQKLDYVATASLENYDDTDLDERWDSSESKREGWMEKTDETSAQGSIALEVRKFLSTIPQVDLEEIVDEDGEFGIDDALEQVESRLIEVKDDLGFPRYIDPSKSHSQLMELLRGVQDERHMMRMLKDEYGRPKQLWLTPVIDRLEKNPRLMTQFFADFGKAFQPYSIFFEDKKESKRTGSKYWKTKIINRLSNLLGGDYSYRITYGKALSSDSIFEDSSMTRRGNVNWSNLGTLRDTVNDWVRETPTTNVFARSDAKLIQRGKDAPSKSEKAQFLYKTLRAMGIDAKMETIERIVTSNDIYKVRDILSDYFESQIGIDKDAKASGLSLVIKDFSSFKSKDYSKMSEMSMVEFYNKLHKDNSPIKEHTEKLLNIVTKHQEGMRLEPRARYGDKTVFSHVAPNFMSDRFDRIESIVTSNIDESEKKKKLRQYLISEYCDNSFMAERNPSGKVTHVYNYWVRQLLEACDTPNNVMLEDTFAGVFKFQRDLGNAEMEFENFTSKLHGLDMIISYFADELQNKGIRGLYEEKGVKGYPKLASALYPTFVLGDSGVSKYIRAPRILEDDNVGKDRAKTYKKWGEKSKAKIVDLLYEVYKQEKRRMELVDKMNKKLASEGYKGVRSTNEFSTLVFLNEEKYALPENPKESDIKLTIRKYMDDATETFIERAKALGILDEQKDKNGKPTGRLANLNQLGTPETINERIEDFFWNTKFATIQQLQMMTVDPSFYKNTKDLQKRYKEVHAPGTKLSLLARNPFKEGNPYFNNVTFHADGTYTSDPETALYFDDIELNVEDTDPAFAAAIKANPRTAKAIEDYRESSLTDGQGFRTLESYRKVLGMAGKWTHEMENVYNEIMALREKYGRRVPEQSDSDFEDYMNRLDSIAKKAVVFMPIKPYMFGHESYTINNGTYTSYADKMLIPVQHKYAEAVLIPELLPKGSQIRDLAYWMDEHIDEKTGKKAPVDLVCATTVVKVGSFGSTNIKGVKDRAAFVEALNKGYIHKLDYRDYRIQQPVPEHINSSQLFGTQVRKLIMSHLNLSGTYNYLRNLTNAPKNGTINLGGRWKNVDANDLRGRNLLALYNSLIVANIMESYDEFAKAVGDVNKLSDILMQSVMANKRESMDNLLSYAVTGDEKFLIPLFEGGLEHYSAGMLLSIFKKRVNKQTIKGGSAVQVSAFGIHGYSRDGGLRYVTDPKNPDNILYAECEIPFALDFYDVKTKSTVSLDFDTYCNLDGTLKVGKYLEKDDPEYDKYQSYEDEKGRYKPKIEMEFPDILSLIAYRIPTERDYSMINLRVKRFSRKTAGGTIKVPPQGTKIAGFDFDIDKLYFIRREYRKHTNSSQYDEKYFSDEVKGLIFEEIYSQHHEIEDALMIARNKENPSSRKPLNRFWKDANIESRFGFNKNELFEYTARELGFEPEIEAENPDEEYFEKYNYDETPENNTRVARNNLLVDLIQARLMDYETFSERYTPGGFFKASKAARKMRELLFGSLKGLETNASEELERRATDKSEKDPEPNYDPTDPMTIIVYNQQNQVAGKLIGIFANQNTNHAFASLMDSFIVKPDFAIEFAGHSYNTDGVGRDFINPPHRADGMNDVNLYVAELLAASVDAVKDPVLNFLNLNTITADSGAVLMRLGYTAEEVGLLFNQPIIRELCEYSFNNSLNVKIALKDLKSKLEGSANVKAVPKYITKEVLTNGIINDRKFREAGRLDYSISHAEEQLAVLYLFERIQNVASDVSAFVTNTKFTASNAVSSTFGGMYAQQMRVDKYNEMFVPDKEGNISSLTTEMKVVIGNETLDSIDIPISNRTDILDMNIQDYMDTLRMNPFSYEQAMFDANRKAIRLLAPTDKSKKALYPYGRHMYERARNMLRSVVDYNLDDETIDALHRDLVVYLLANETNSEFCGERQKYGNDISNREYYLNHFVDDMLRTLEDNPKLKELAIFQYLRPEEVTDDKGNVIGYKLMIQDIGGLNPTTAEEIKESWASLVEIDEDESYVNEDYANLGIDLFMYCFYKLGYDFSPNTFMDLAPTAIKEEITIRKTHSSPVKTFTETDGMNDIYVFYPGYAPHANKAWEDYGYENGISEGLVGNSYAFPRSEDGDFSVNSLAKLCLVALNNSDKTFKFQAYLDQEDIDKIANYNIPIPGNIQFTEDSVFDNDWSNVSYNKNVSYAEYLNEILDGTNDSLDAEKFIKQFIKNHLDNWRFVLNTSSGELNKFFKDKVETSNFGQPLGVIEVDASKADDTVRSSIVNIKYGSTGEIIVAKWKPVIKIGDSYYMATGSERFDINKSLIMNYELFKPFGVKGQSKMYKSDIAEYVKPESRDEEDNLSPQLPESQGPITEPSDHPMSPQVTKETLLRIIDVNMLNYIISTMTNDNGSKVTEAEGRQILSGFKAGQNISMNTEESVLQAIVDNIKEQVRSEGLTFLDENGNETECC